MNKSKEILGRRTPGSFSLEERKMIIEEYLRTHCTKQFIWQKYTGNPIERGHLLDWMRQLGYAKTQGSHEDNLQKPSLLPQPEVAQNPVSSESYAQLELKIQQLEKALVQSELRATALETIIEVAEKELKVSIKKKSYTKLSPE